MLCLRGSSSLSLILLAVTVVFKVRKLRTQFHSDKSVSKHCLLLLQSGLCVSETHFVSTGAGEGALSGAEAASTSAQLVGRLCAEGVVMVIGHGYCGGWWG